MCFSGLGLYFNIKHGLRKDAIKVILDKLYEIEKWFLSQKKFAFYASSLLLVYEGDMQHNDFFMSCNQCSHGDCKCSSSGSSGSRHTMSTDTIDNTSSGATTDSTDQTSLEVDTELSDATEESSMTASVSSISVDNQSATTDNQSTSCVAPVNNHNAIIADVRMIDFTHVFNVNETDENYLYGLQNLLSNLQQLLDLDL